MDDGENSRQTDGPASTADSGLRCPNCRYNLTGLSCAKCPECGRALNWDEIRAAAVLTPQIHFEKASIAFKPIGFVLTWLTILFSPWVFARRAVLRIGVAHAVTFGVLCLCGVFLSLFFDASLEYVVTWLTTALIYLVFQTVLLTLIEPNGWRRPLKTSAFWALIGCYTSAIMLTEISTGPPPVYLSGVVEFLLGRSGGLDSILSFDASLAWWLQMVIWLIGLACCYYARMRRAGADAFSAASASFLVAACLFLLYSATVEYIGVRWLYDIFDDMF